MNGATGGDVLALEGDGIDLISYLRLTPTQ